MDKSAMVTYPGSRLLSRGLAQMIGPGICIAASGCIATADKYLDSAYARRSAPEQSIEDYILSHPTLPKAHAESLRKHEIRVGMSKETLDALLGQWVEKRNDCLWVTEPSGDYPLIDTTRLYLYFSDAFDRNINELVAIICRGSYGIYP